MREPLGWAERFLRGVLGERGGAGPVPERDSSLRVLRRFFWRRSFAARRFLLPGFFAVDLPGRGRKPADLTRVSVADWVDSVVGDIEDTGLGDVVIVGHSLAGVTVPGVVARLGSTRVRERQYETVSPWTAPTAAQRMTSQTSRFPAADATPAVMSAVSLGTTGKNASSAAIAKTITYVQFESPMTSRAELSSASGTGLMVVGWSSA